MVMSTILLKSREVVNTFVRVVTLNFSAQMKNLIPNVVGHLL